MNRLVIALCLWALLIISVPLAAQDDRASIINPAQASQIALQHVPGRVLKVAVDEYGYRVKVLKESGRVVIVMVDGQSGQIIKVIGNR